MVRPSLNSTHIESAPNRTDFALTEELIPCIPNALPVRRYGSHQAAQRPSIIAIIVSHSHLTGRIQNLASASPFSRERGPPRAAILHSNRRETGSHLPSRSSAWEHFTSPRSGFSGRPLPVPVQLTGVYLSFGPPVHPTPASQDGRRLWRQRSLSSRRPHACATRSRSFARRNSCSDSTAASDNQTERLKHLTNQPESIGVPNRQGQPSLGPYTDYDSPRR